MRYGIGRGRRVHPVDARFTKVVGYCGMPLDKEVPREAVDLNDLCGNCRATTEWRKLVPGVDRPRLPGEAPATGAQEAAGAPLSPAPSTPPGV